MQLFFNLLLAHIIGDFYLQTDKTCEDKKRGIKSFHHYLHALVIFAVTYLFSNAYSTFWMYALGVSITHLIIDCVKSSVHKDGLLTFCIDQLLHVGIIAAAVWWYAHTTSSWTQFVFFGHNDWALVACCVIGCCKPTNILIKYILEKYRIDMPKSQGKELSNAGALIGSLERIICLVLVFVGQYEAIGFIIAAKSILRFKDYETAKTEYVLVGTLLSFGIALLLGLTIKNVIV